MKSELNKRKEKKYYSGINRPILIQLKIKIDKGEEVRPDDLQIFKGPDANELIDYIKQYQNIKSNKKIGFEL
jgi:hypothetical protein